MVARTSSATLFSAQAKVIERDGWDVKSLAAGRDWQLNLKPEMPC
jgi:hypothetical protein